MGLSPPTVLKAPESYCIAEMRTGFSTEQVPCSYTQSKGEGAQG